MAFQPHFKPVPGFGHVIESWQEWWRAAVKGTVDQAAVIASRREECQLSSRYLFMLAMSAGIAVLGLLLSSPAVVIGAMLLSPLMGPIIGLGFALAIGDVPWLKEAARSLAVGTVLAVLLCALVVFASPLQTVTPEIAARTRPNLFDLLVALFSALAGGYAMIRGGAGTVVGVAIATALMPPLAVVGFGLATLNWTVFSGALLLFVTNLMTIALTAAVMARAYGFSSRLSERNTLLQMIAIVLSFLALAVPLGISLRQIAWEAQASRDIRAAVEDVFDGKSRLSQIDINFDAEPLAVSATVLTPELRPDAEQLSAHAIARRLGETAEVAITQYQVGTGSKAAEEAELAKARARAEADRERVEQLATRLALVAGVDERELVIDRERRHAIVEARPMAGAGLQVYRELERRISATEPEWRIELRPPARPLPAVSFADGKPTEAGLQAFDLIVWAAQRIDAPVVLSGPEAERSALATSLEKRGVRVRQVNGNGQSGMVSAAWGMPDG